jgi:hypothetical protein
MSRERLPWPPEQVREWRYQGAHFQPVQDFARENGFSARYAVENDIHDWERRGDLEWNEAKREYGRWVYDPDPSATGDIWEPLGDKTYQIIITDADGQLLGRTREYRSLKKAADAAIQFMRITLLQRKWREKYRQRREAKSRFPTGGKHRSEKRQGEAPFLPMAQRLSRARLKEKAPTITSR